MPELPEVETIRRGLEQKIVNKKIKKVWVEPSFKKKISPNSEKFIRFLKNKIIKKVGRKAKLLYFKVNKDLFVLNHLKMTGQLVFQPKKGDLTFGGHPIDELEILPNKFTRVIFEFFDGSKLFYNDIRKFGYFKAVNKLELEQELNKYGIEGNDKNFDFTLFNELLNKRPKAKLKVFLLDQKFVSGLGNIYVDESCFKAGVLPTRLIKDVSLEKRKALLKAIKKVLDKAIKYQGTSVNNYVSSKGAPGQFQNFLKVYGRSGEKCQKCKKSIIKKVKLAGRSTCFCEKCQK